MSVVAALLQKGGATDTWEFKTEGQKVVQSIQDMGSPKYVPFSLGIPALTCGREALQNPWLDDYLAAALAADRDAKAAKANNVLVLVELWHKWVEPMFPHLLLVKLEEALVRLRAAALRWWKRHLQKEAIKKSTIVMVT